MTPNRALYVTLLLIAASVTLGIRSYSQAESRIVADLNQALHLSVLQNQSLWLSTDSIQTYARLQQTLHAPIASIAVTVPLPKLLPFRSSKTNRNSPCTS